ncbi:MAG TPA: galactokinase [Bryobacteraceae bacterium]|nr:galactokinase [Bryobacteraceae bacterium]
MLISRTPMRISIGGGGTDLPSYYRRYGGCVISAAINRYIFIAINRIFTNDYVLKYSSQERVDSIDDIEHPIFREALKMHSLSPGYEICSLADIPAGTGLGSSGAFTVGLLRAIHAARCEYVSAREVAEEACHIEIDRIGQSIGKQDQYIAAFGGLTCFDFREDGHITVSKLKISPETMSDLSDHLLMFFTGYSRSANALLEDQKKRTDSSDASMIEGLHQTKQLGYEIKAALEAGNAVHFGELMHEHWLRKRARSSGMTNECIDHWYKVGMANGALGGKLIGAGGGGFLMFYTLDPAQLRRAMAQQNLQEVRFKFDHDGSTIICRD